MYSLRVTDDLSSDSPLHRLVSNLSDVKTRLESRRKVSPQEFADILKLRETTHHKGINEIENYLLSISFVAVH